MSQVKLTIETSRPHAAQWTAALSGSGVHPARGCQHRGSGIALGRVTARLLVHEVRGDLGQPAGYLRPDGR